MKPQGDAGQAPVHTQEAMKLAADGYAHLIKIQMSPPGEGDIELHFTPQKTVVWQGHTWNSYAIGITDYANDASGEMSRPKMTVGNPQGVFSGYVHRRWMDSAIVTRYRVLGQHLDANVNSYLQNTWRMRRVVSLSPVMVVFELGGVLDGPLFMLPARAFYPPEFPTVSV